MKILHIVEDFSLNSGGLRTVIKNLDFHIKSLGYKSYILASKKEIEDDIFLVKSNNKWLYSKNWILSIDSIVNKYGIEIIHIHGVWLYPQLIGAKYAIRNKIPLVLSAHGMYQPWLWKKGTLKKKIYFYFLSKKWFSKASVIHAITPDETQNLKLHFQKNIFIEIPNLISMNTEKEQVLNTKKYVLYLGRLNKTKGIDLLIKAFSQIENQTVKLKIAGGFNHYKEELESLVKSLNLTKQVEFLGLVKNEIKNDLIRNSWVMVSPSHSDVIGMVNLEAASFKTPVITTFKVGLKKEWNTNGGKLINPNIEELKNALIEVFSWTVEERNTNGKHLYDFVKQHYSWNLRLKDWRNLYEIAVKNEK